MRLTTALLLALLTCVGCSYYSADLLSGIGDAGPSPGGNASTTGGSSSSAGSSSPAGGGAQAGSQASVGGSEAGMAMVSAGAGGSDDEMQGGAGAYPGGAGGADEGPIDACPADPNKLEPGQCGCGAPEICVDLKAGLAHRYSFAQQGMVAADSIGDADGTIVGTSASAGKVSFDGVADAYVDLPNGIVSSLQDASFELWLQWGGGAIWQRILDFGTNDLGEGKQGEGTTYLYLTPSDGSTSRVLRASFTSNGLGSETSTKASAPLAMGTSQHLVLVVDDTRNELRLYLNGSVAALSGFSQSLSSLKDVNNWIGRSNFKDAPLKATIEEVRIYRVALDQAQVKASYDFGPNPGFL